MAGERSGSAVGGGGKYVVALLVIPTLFPLILLTVVTGATMPPSTAATCADAVPLSSLVGAASVDAGQRAVADQIVRAVRAYPPTAAKARAAVIAIATARQESGLQNLDYGDRDSLGVFQQRPSQGWGTPAQVVDVAHATTSFLTRLVQIPGWETRRITDVAADVQRPAAAYRGLYQQWVPLAEALTAQLWTQTASLLPVAAACGGTDQLIPPPGAGGGGDVIARAQSWVDEDVPYSQSSFHVNAYGTYRQDCSGYVSMVWGLALSYTTASLPTIARPITKDELRAGDIMLKPGHTLIFDEWADAAHARYWAYEEQRPGRVAVHYVVPYPYWAGQGRFSPYRKR